MHAHVLEEIYLNFLMSNLEQDITCKHNYITYIDSWQEEKWVSLLELLGTAS